MTGHRIFLKSEFSDGLIKGQWVQRSFRRIPMKTSSGILNDCLQNPLSRHNLKVTNLDGFQIRGVPSVLCTRSVAEQVDNLGPWSPLRVQLIEPRKRDSLVIEFSWLSRLRLIWLSTCWSVSLQALKNPTAAMQLLIKFNIWGFHTGSDTFQFSLRLHNFSGQLT
jgi:hypothetical protein